MSATTAPAGNRWTAGDIPDLAGRTAVVTGANSGLGYETALQLAIHGAHVVLGCRDRARGDEAANRITAAQPRGTVEIALLDLASLRSVREFAEAFRTGHTSLDILVNNAGRVGGPRSETADGFESHLGVNHFGHFALTGLLLPALLAGDSARVVGVSSNVAARASIDFDNLHSDRPYRMMTAYAQSKLANLLFAAELERRARAAGTGLRSLAAHPGVARTNVLVNKSADWGRPRQGVENVIRLLQLMFGHPAAAGALPILYQATAPMATASRYIIAKRFPRVHPAPVAFPKAALDHDTAQRLWRVSEQLTSVSYDALPR
jgi:NAD(P)-dependent dehydrogenase (short-subunit alcohol dehydrogenase family)